MTSEWPVLVEVKSSRDSRTWAADKGKVAPQTQILMSKRRTWACLLVLVYTLLPSSSWTLLHSIMSWYNSNVYSTSSNGARVTGWPALYA
uniref:Uncharacterized protein n=1 Tax=Nelumbo nucifera TaxID=4432 RepID=A0A822YAC3_NELNU|nr:TPA_asm: hypothetical protein HUJ06_029534 [Nelumbo nucifera]